MVPLRRSSAKSRMVMSGIISRRMTLKLENSGRSTPSVTFRPPPVGFMADCIDTRA